MKVIVWNLILFVVFAFALSSLSGCGGAANTSDGNATANIAGNQSEDHAVNSSESGKGKTASEYPPLKADIAQADLKTMDGSTFKIADKKGKVILVNMWATWCGPCLSEMPSFVKMQEKYGPQGFEILGLVVTEDKKETL